MSAGSDLQEAWRDLLGRRATLAPSLELYGPVLEAWATASPALDPVRLDAATCRTRWSEGVPMLGAVAPLLGIEGVEEPLGAAMEALAAAAPALSPALQELARAWDAGIVGPAALLPQAGRIGSGVIEEATRLPTPVVAFLATAALRPALSVLFGGTRDSLAEGAWALGVCPWCGGPPGFVDVVEDGRRRLACHLCDGTWPFAKLRCPLCGVDGAEHVARLLPEGNLREEGYAIAACRECRAYVKELDRRARWNAGPALIEDWGSPHLDLIAHRAGYWRPGFSLLDLANAR